MLLYHFTLIGNLPSIMEHGLIPKASTDLFLEGRELVWLTQTPELFTQRSLNIMRADPELFPEIDDPNMMHNNVDVRLTVTIPSGDVRLKNWRKWFKKRLQKNGQTPLPMIDLVDWYFYLGTIKPDRIIAESRLEMVKAA